MLNNNVQENIFRGTITQEEYNNDNIRKFLMLLKDRNNNNNRTIFNLLTPTEQENIIRKVKKIVYHQYSLIETE